MHFHGLLALGLLKLRVVQLPAVGHQRRRSSRLPPAAVLFRYGDGPIAAAADRPRLREVLDLIVLKQETCSGHKPVPEAS